MDPGTQAAKSPTAGYRSVGPFAAKAVIVAVICLASFWLIFSWVDSVVDRRVRQFEATFKSATKIGGRDFWTKIESELEAQAAGKSDLSPEKKQRILAQLKMVSDRWRPFATDVFTVISGEANPPHKP
jgi:hypothetical protein